MPTFTIRPSSREAAFLLAAFVNRPENALAFEAICRNGRVHILAPAGTEDADIAEVVQSFAAESNGQLTTPEQRAVARALADGLPLSLSHD